MCCGIWLYDVRLLFEARLHGDSAAMRVCGDVWVGEFCKLSRGIQWLRIRAILMDCTVFRVRVKVGITCLSLRIPVEAFSEGRECDFMLSYIM